MSARVARNGRCYQLDRPAQPDENITEEDAKDAAKLARLLLRLLKDVATLKRRWFPRRLDFEDVDVDATATTEYRFPHNFGGRVRWWPVEWRDPSLGGAGPSFVQVDGTDNNTLVVVSYLAGTVTMRIEEAG